MRRQLLEQTRTTASATKRGLLVLGLLTCGACLVTKDVDFSVDNSPPAVIGAVGDLKPEKLARVPEVSDPKCPVVADAIFMRFEAKIVDIDVDQTLQARLLVNGNPVGQGQRQIGPAPMNARERNFQPFCINADDLRSPCNLVELIVSSAFDPLAASDPYATVLPDDLGHYEWWVIGSAASQADVRPADCFATVQPRDGGIP